MRTALIITVIFVGLQVLGLFYIGDQIGEIFSPGVESSRGLTDVAGDAAADLIPGDETEQVIEGPETGPCGTAYPYETAADPGICAKHAEDAYPPLSDEEATKQRLNIMEPGSLVPGYVPPDCPPGSHASIEAGYCVVE